MKKTHDSWQRLGILLIALHFLVSLVHGMAHSRLHIEMNLWQSVYILIVITLLPLISGFLVWRGAPSGFVLLAFSMLGALVFGGYYHFIAAGADNVASLGSVAGAQPFQLTAALLAITEATGVLIGILGVLKKQQEMKGESAIRVNNR